MQQQRPSPNEIEAELAQIAARWEEPVPEVDLETLVELKRREQGLPFPGKGARPLRTKTPLWSPRS